MSPKPSTNGLLPKLKQFLDALADRYFKALAVIDEALDSESMKDKIWAVDLILKRTPSDATATDAIAKKGKRKPSKPAELEHLSETELLDRIREHMQAWEP